MTKFLKLSKNIINAKYIRKIFKDDTMYHISLHAPLNNIKGFQIFGAGWLFGDFDGIDLIRIGKTTEPEDYAKLESWIEKLEE